MSPLFIFTAFAPALFQGIGDLAGGESLSIANAVNNQMQIVGRSTSGNGTEAFRWTPSGMLGLDDFSGGIFESHSFGLSTNGQVVVGYGIAASGQRAFRWTSATGLLDLGDLPGGTDFSFAVGCSENGDTIVGVSNGTLGQEGFRWTVQNGIQGIGDLAGGIFSSQATAVSADGAVIAGSGVSSRGDEAFRWTQQTGCVGLGDLPGSSFYSFANAMNASGNVIVGHSRSSRGDEAFRWEQGFGMVALGDLPGGGFNSVALGVSADGAIVVGQGTTANGPRAFIWTTGTTITDLASYLTSKGASVTGWALTAAKAISPDGRYIVGDGVNPQGNEEAWVATIDPTVKGAQFISQSSVPASLVAGTQFTASIVMRNTGNVPWTQSGNDALGSRNPVDNRNWGVTRIFMGTGDICEPGNQYSFTRLLTAPWAPGTYNYQWKGTQIGVGWFGDLTPNLVIQITRGVNAATFVSSSGVPTTVPAGSSFTASLTFKNVGSATWTSAANFRLGSANPYNNVYWGASRLELPNGASIKTGNQVTFQHTFTAPSTPGVYTFQWRMIKSGVAFFGEISPSVKITVT